jgi:ATP-dependent helicase/DNAse subunit B
MESIKDSYWLKIRIDSVLDVDKFMNYSISQKIGKLKYLKRWIKNSLENSMYPQEETKKLKDLRIDIDNNLVALNKNKRKEL